LCGESYSSSVVARRDHVKGATSQMSEVVVSRSKVPICIAPIISYSSPKRSGMARVNEGSHSFTCHPHVYPQVEWTIPAFTSQPQSITTLWPVLIFRPFFYSRHVIIFTTFFIFKNVGKWHTQQQIKMSFSFVML